MSLEEIENLIFEIETKHQNVLESYEEWSLLRNRLYMNLLKGINGDGKKNNLKSLFNKKFIENIFYGLGNWFKSYDTLVFTNDQYRKLINGVYFDRVVDSFIERDEEKRSLFVSLTEHSFRPLHLVYSKHIVSQTILDLCGFLSFKLLLKKQKDFSSLQAIFSNYGLEFNVRKEMKMFWGYYRFYKLFFQIYKPNRIFVATYYSATRNYMVKAANDSGIMVIEGQHGYVGDAHPSYNSELNLDPSYLPKEFWVFSEFDKKSLSIRGIYNQSQIKIKGDYFLDMLKKEGRKPNDQLKDFTEKYQYIVGASLQIPLENEFIPFILDMAALNSDIGYILIPRVWDEKYKKTIIPENVIFIKDVTFYEVIFWCTHHTTVFSTTALESEYLGIPNILIDIDGFATKYFGKLFSADKIVDDKARFIQMVKTK